MLVMLALWGCGGPVDPNEVGEDGGELVFGDVRVVVPAGALSEDVILRLIDTGESPPEPWVGLSNVLRFEPEDLVFTGAITVDIPFAPADADARLWQADGTTWSQHPHTAAEGRLTADLSVLAPLFVAERPFSEIEVADPYPPADVLIVVDDSCSMSEEQAQLGAQLGGLLPDLLGSGLDVHVGVTTTDTTNEGLGTQGELIPVDGERFLTATTPDPEALFASMVNVGTDGHLYEMGREAFYTLIEEKADAPANQGFYRPEGTLHGIFVTDEDDWSDPNPVTRAEFVAWAQALKAHPADVVLHGIYVIPGNTCPFAYPPEGLAYDVYVDSTGGEKVLICDPDWSPGLTAMADRLFDTARVTLPEDPSAPPQVILRGPSGDRLLDPTQYAWDPATRTVRFDQGTRPGLDETVVIRWLPVEAPVP